MIPLNIRYCIKCKKAFDIDTSKELCPKCRNKKEEFIDGIKN